MKFLEPFQPQNSKTYPLLIGSVATFVFVGFYFYSGFRTFGETVGFNLSSTIVGLIFALVLPSIVLSPVLVSISARYRWAFFTSLLFGCMIGEFQLLHDEAAFAKQAAGATTIYSRDRAWPNGNSSLVFVPGQGIHDSG